MAVKKLVREDGNEILVDRALKDADGGTIASQEWVQENVPQGPKGDKGDPGSIEGAGFPLTLQNSTGVVKAEFNSGIKSSTEMIQTPHLDLQDANDKARYTAYGIIPFSSSASSATGKLLSFPIGEEGTFATREWSQENVSQKVLEPGWGDAGVLPQSKVSNMPSWPTAAVAVSVIVTRMGLGAFVPQDGKRYECLFSIGGTLYLTSFLVSGERATFDTGNREALKPGDIVTANGVTMMIKQEVGTGAAKNIWDIAVPLRGRFPVMPLTTNNSLTIQDMRECDMKIYFSGTSRSVINIFSARNCSLLIDTKDYAETSTGGGSLSFQSRIYGDNATLVQGATPVLRDNSGNPPSICAPYSTVGNEIYITVNYIQYDQNGVCAPNADGIMYNNMWLCPFRSTWTFSDGDEQKDFRLNFRYEFAESGQPRMDVIPYIVPHVETQSASVMSEPPEQPEDTQSPIVPSGRRGCFTLDDEGHTIDAFTGEIIE